MLIEISSHALIVQFNKLICKCNRLVLIKPGEDGDNRLSGELDDCGFEDFRKLIENLPCFDQIDLGGYGMRDRPSPSNTIDRSVELREFMSSFEYREASYKAAREILKRMLATIPNVMVGVELDKYDDFCFINDITKIKLRGDYIPEHFDPKYNQYEKV